MATAHERESAAKAEINRLQLKVKELEEENEQLETHSDYLDAVVYRQRQCMEDNGWEIEETLEPEDEMEEYVGRARPIAGKDEIIKWMHESITYGALRLLIKEMEESHSKMGDGAEALRLAKLKYDKVKAFIDFSDGFNLTLFPGFLSRVPLFPET